MQINIGLEDCLMQVNINKKIGNRTDKYSGRYEVYLYQIKNITDPNGVEIVNGDQVDRLIELLNAFAANQLENIQYKISNTATAIINSEFGKRLKLSVANGKTYYLDIYRCRVIASKLRRIVIKCIENDMIPHDLSIKNM